MNLKALYTRNKAAIWQLVYLVLPILAAHQTGALLSFVNSTLAGRQHPLWFAAIGMANTAFSTAMGLGWGIITAVGILTAGQLGKYQDGTRTGLILKASLLTSVFMSVPIMLLLKYMQPIWVYFNQSPEVIQLSQAYLDGLIWVVFVDFVKFAIFQFAIAHHRTIVPLMVTLFSIPVLIVTNYFFIQYLGIYGLGLGTSLVDSLACLVLWVYCYRDRVFSHCLNHSASWRTYLKLSYEQFRLGIPIGLMSTIEVLFFFIIGLWVGNMGNEALIAHHLAVKWLIFTIMTAVSFSEAITILIAKAEAQAQNSLRDAKKFLWIGVYLTTIAMSLFSMLYWIAPRLIIQWDLGTCNNPKIIGISVATLAICGVFQIFDGIRIAFSGALRGLSDTQYPMWVTLLTFWGIGLPTAYFCAFTLGWQQVGLWCGMTAAVLAMSILQYFRIQRLLKDL